ncbi:hypothetical protein AUK40_04415 [Candidatus Wirthbacteria bacterium CG2_30_54_11]|uniref:EamA domain-containing protein n=1 Tax=Candidatus Wirthbacteria bacterium CG2_30_54_11 TaxID=1817892 RepID=A0A1J5IR38_9BACT|nr:MAG: hypothetical protein AUK40_04415 [Candidatus Wirthbacteria bacterium CG2_30_54_11]
MNPYLSVILAALIWGSSGAFVRILGIPSTSLSFFRLAVPTLVLGIYFGFQRGYRFNFRDRTMLLTSLLNAVRVPLYYLGFMYCSIGTAVILTYTWPVFATILSSLLFKEKNTRRDLAMVFLAFTGTVIISSSRDLQFTDRSTIGMGALIVSSLLYSLTVLLFKKHASAYTPAETIMYQNFAGAVIYTPVFFFTNPKPALWQVGTATIYAILIGLVAFGLFFFALKKIKSSHAAILAYMEIISALIFAISFFHEHLTWNLIVGGLFILSSAFTLSRKPESGKKISPESNLQV